MAEHLESLRIENKKLRGKHNEMESNLTEEKEMVKYLHGVIKNYQQLLKKPDATRLLKTASLKKTRRSTTARRLASESDAEDLFVKKLVAMSSDLVKNKGDKDESLPACEVTANNYKVKDAAVVVDTSNCENTDSINTTRQDRPDENLSSKTVIKDNIQAELTSDKDTTFRNEKSNGSDSVRGNRDFPSEAENVTETRSKYIETGNMLQEMAQMLDSMMAKATIHENGLKQKDKHLKRMERRYEYLASIALGEESEWL